MIIFVITHKRTDINLEKGYQLLMVGANGKSVPEGYLRDDQGCNISSLNDSYCELTGLYWIWKNSIEDLVGLVHYRRFFVDFVGASLGQRCITPNKETVRVLSEADINQLLSHYDLIVKKSISLLNGNNEKTFRQVLGNETFSNLVSCISKKSDAKSFANFEKYLSRRFHINANMFVGRKTVIDEYCQWLFPILGELDDIHIEKHMERYHNRELGYVGELLFGFWLDNNNINYKVWPVINTESKPYESGGIITPGELIMSTPRLAQKGLRAFWNNATS